MATLVNAKPVVKASNAIESLALDLYKELKAKGLIQKEILNVISGLIELLTEEKLREQKRSLVSV